MEEDGEVQLVEEDDESEDGESDDEVEEAPPQRQRRILPAFMTPQKPRKRTLGIRFTPTTRKALKRATDESLNPSLKIRKINFQAGKTITLSYRSLRAWRCPLKM